MDEDYTYEGDFIPPANVDGAGDYFISGTAIEDPPPPEGNPDPLPLESNEWAVEFYELEVE